MEQSNSPLLEIICGPFNLGTWDIGSKVFKNGHHLSVSTDKSSLVVKRTNENGVEIDPPVCTHSIVSGTFVGIVVNQNQQLVIQQPKINTSIKIEIAASQILKAKLDKWYGTVITSFIGTDDLRQGRVLFSNCLHQAVDAGINVRFDESTSKLVIEY